MDKYSLEKLELLKIIEQLAEFAATRMGQEVIINLKPICNREKIEKKLKGVTSAREILDDYGQPPLGGIRDLRDILKKVTREMVLTTEQIRKVSTCLQGLHSLKKFFQEIIEKNQAFVKKYKLLIEPALKITVLYSLEKKINSCFDGYGELKDDASPKLKSLRQKIKATEEKIRSKLEGIIKGTRFQSMLQDNLITRRDNRYVVPVKQEHRHTFKGIVHDQSASGLTFFMEPMVVVDLNNRLREIKNEEQKEIHRILKKLSLKIFFHKEEIKINLQLATYFDVVFAKAAYSKLIKGRAPRLNERGIIKLKQARHPLLQNKTVPIDLEVGAQNSTLVITGPNTGGKTVALKTIGLFVLMVEVGLHLPVAAGTNISFFEQTFADIGDEQSIEQNLSTFSSHMTKIKNYLEKADHRTLVLLDELGVGTEPKEGAALGIAILEQLKAKKVITVATTHYNQLKSYAYSTRGVENASVEFDLETLRPTYKLIMGVPGGSNAFEIALKLGLSEKIIRDAKKLVNQDELKVENIIRDLHEQRIKYRQLKTENQKTNRLLTELKEDYENKLKTLTAREKKIINEAHRQAKEIVKRTHKKVKAILKKLKNQDFTLRSEIDRTDNQIHHQLKNIEKELTGVKNKEQTPNKVKKFKVGDTVRVKSGGREGEIIEIDQEKKEAVIQAGVLKITASLADLIPAEIPADQKSKIVKQYRVQKAGSIFPKIDLRGERYTEAQRKLDKYLDDAVLAGYTTVEIVHGKGTGALQEAVAEVLEKNPHVTSTRYGKQAEGGTGVTITKLRT